MSNKRTFESFANELLDSLNERSIAKIQKEWTQVTAIMKDTVEKWKAAEGSEKEDLKNELKTLTISKNKLESELDTAVGLKDIDAELAEHHTDNPNDKYEVRPCDEPGTPFAVWEGDYLVKCFKTEEEAQAYADKENSEQGLDEGTMSDIHQLAGEVKDLAQFTKEFFKRFGDKIKKTADSEEWVGNLYKDMTNESVVNEAVARDTKIYCIATPAPKAMLVEELENLFGDDYRHYITEFNDDEGFESILVFNLTKRDIKMIQENIGDVLIWEYSIKKGKEIMESVVTEGKKVTLKRRYTENHPAISVGKAAKIRNKMLEAIKDGNITQEEFDNILKEMTTDSKRWMKRNAKYFSVSEEGIKLSRFGDKLLRKITVNEAYDGNMSDFKYEYPNVFTEVTGVSTKAIKRISKKGKGFEVRTSSYMGEESMKAVGAELGLELKSYVKSNIVIAIYESIVTEKTTKNPELWVPGGFDKEMSRYPNSKIDLKLVHKLADKYDVDHEDAVKYVEYGWDLDLNEQKHTNMKTKLVFESFTEFVGSLNESVVNEAFASTKLASILTGANKMDKDLPKAFYQMAKIKLDKIQDVDIIEMDPATAKKEKRANAVYLYFTTNEKENPYAGKSAWREEKTIPANTLLAITDGSNEWMTTEWQRAYSRSQKPTRVLKKTKRDDSAGFPKSGARSEYGSGISSMKQVADLADRAYCLDLDILRARYSTANLRDERAAAKKGAIAFKNDKDFKAENLNRYNDIIANRASKMPIDKMVKDAIDTISKQIADGIAKGEKGRYGDLIVGRSGKGNEAKLSDAANHMQRILDDFQRYVNYTDQAEKEKEAGYGGDYYAREVKNYAKNITDRIKQIEGFTYAW